MRTVLIAVILSFAGCQGFLAERMVAPPNALRPARAIDEQVTADGRELRIPVGPPAAVLAVWVREPAKDVPVRGTILCLHGLLNDHSQLSGAAQALCDAGYRTVLVDLRGHGDSTGDYISYGVFDARDLAQVTTYLQAQGLCGPTVGVFGVSYGAATAIQYAAADARVTAVVAVAPFASLRTEAPYFGKHLLPVPAMFFSADDFTQVVDGMGHLAGFDPDACDTVAAIQKTHAAVRLFHGDADMITPVDASRALAAADPERAMLTVLPMKGHLELCFDVFGELRAGTREWFEQHL